MSPTLPLPTDAALTAPHRSLLAVAVGITLTQSRRVVSCPLSVCVCACACVRADVSSVTVANSTLGLALGSAALLGVLFGFAFSCCWSACVGDRKGVRVRSARESLVKGAVYTSTLQQPATNSCAIM